MASIPIYSAPDQRLRPDERGNEAYTRAGRYVGQYRRQTADDIRQGGVLQNQSIRERGWPFDILALEEDAAGGRGGGGGRGGFRAIGGSAGDIGRGATFGGDSGARNNAKAARQLDPEIAAGLGRTRAYTGAGARALGRVARVLGQDNALFPGDAPNGVSVLHGTTSTMMDPVTGLPVRDQTAREMAAEAKRIYNMQASMSRENYADILAPSDQWKYWQNYYGNASNISGNPVDTNQNPLDAQGNQQGTTYDSAGTPVPAGPGVMELSSPDPIAAGLQGFADSIGNSISNAVDATNAAGADATSIGVDPYGMQ
jgi:hypothetical protein